MPGFRVLFWKDYSEEVFWVITHLRYLWAASALRVSDHNALNYSGQDRNGEPVLICCQPREETALYKGLVISVAESTQLWWLSSEHLSAADCPEQCLNFRLVSAALCPGSDPAVLAPCSVPCSEPSAAARREWCSVQGSAAAPSCYHHMYQETPQNDVSRTNCHPWPRYSWVLVRKLWSNRAPVLNWYKVTMELATSRPTDMRFSLNGLLSSKRVITL